MSAVLFHSLSHEADLAGGCRIAFVVLLTTIVQHRESHIIALHGVRSHTGTDVE
jgi:hypothetical protein